LPETGYGDSAIYIKERDSKHVTAELQVLVVVNAQISTTRATISPTTVGEQMQTLEVLCGQLEMLAVISEPGCSQMRLGSEKPQS
jgi:hypothetical protein